MKVTVLEPCAVPKLAPEMTTDVPTGPEVGDRELTTGAVTTVKDNAFDVKPETATITLPVEAPLGTRTTICESLQAEGGANVPFSVTVLVP